MSRLAANKCTRNQKNLKMLRVKYYFPLTDFNQNFTISLDGSKNLKYEIW